MYMFEVWFETSSCNSITQVVECKTPEEAVLAVKGFYSGVTSIGDVYLLNNKGDRGKRLPKDFNSLL